MTILKITNENKNKAKNNAHEIFGGDNTKYNNNINKLLTYDECLFDSYTKTIVGGHYTNNSGMDMDIVNKDYFKNSHNFSLEYSPQYVYDYQFEFFIKLADSLITCYDNQTNKIIFDQYCLDNRVCFDRIYWDNISLWKSVRSDKITNFKKDAQDK